MLQLCLLPCKLLTELSQRLAEETTQMWVLYQQAYFWHLSLQYDVLLQPWQCGQQPNRPQLAQT